MVDFLSNIYAYDPLLEAACFRLLKMGLTARKMLFYLSFTNLFDRHPLSFSSMDLFMMPFIFEVTVLFWFLTISIEEKPIEFCLFELLYLNTIEFSPGFFNE